MSFFQYMWGRRYIHNIAQINWQTWANPGTAPQTQSCVGQEVPKPVLCIAKLKVSQWSVINSTKCATALWEPAQFLKGAAVPPNDSAQISDIEQYLCFWTHFFFYQQIFLGGGGTMLFSKVKLGVVQSSVANWCAVHCSMALWSQRCMVLCSEVYYSGVQSSVVKYSTVL